MGRSFAEVLATCPGEGWLHIEEAQLLWKCCEETVGPILEVGCYCGRSTVFLAAHGRQVYCVDPFAGFNCDDPTGDGIAQRFLESMVFNNITNVTQFRMRVEDWEPMPVGFAYLDGDHTYQGTIDQIKVAQKCSPRIIAIHDVNDYGAGRKIKQAAVELLGAWDERVARLAVWRLK